MTLAPVDWPLVLEFTKALAEPLAIFGAAWIAAHLSISAYARHKLLDRKTKWIEDTTQRLADLVVVYHAAPGSKEKTEAARDELVNILFLTMHGAFYVTPVWQSALDEWMASAGRILKSKSDIATDAEVADVGEVVGNFLSALARELRTDYKLPSYDGLSDKKNGESG